MATSSRVPRQSQAWDQTRKKTAGLEFNDGSRFQGNFCLQISRVVAFSAMRPWPLCISSNVEERGDPYSRDGLVPGRLPPPPLVVPCLARLPQPVCA